MLSGKKRVAYHRIPSHELMFSETPMSCGKKCGKILNIQMKVWHYHSSYHVAVITCSIYNLEFIVILRNLFCAKKLSIRKQTSKCKFLNGIVKVSLSTSFYLLRSTSTFSQAFESDNESLYIQCRIM